MECKKCGKHLSASVRWGDEDICTHCVDTCVACGVRLTDKNRHCNCCTTCFAYKPIKKDSCARCGQPIDRANYKHMGNWCPSCHAQANHEEKDVDGFAVDVFFLHKRLW